MPAFGTELTSFPSAGADDTCLHHTRIEVLSPRGGDCTEPGIALATEKPSGALLPSSSKRWLNRDCSPVSARCGGGAAHVQHTRPSSSIEEPERASNQCAGIRDERPMC
jgi:hypothetical protein